MEVSFHHYQRVLWCDKKLVQLLELLTVPLVLLEAIALSRASLEG
jgi:hypothetical protein